MFSRSFINSSRKMTPWVLVTPRKQYSMQVPTWKLYLSSGEIAGTSSIRNSPTSTRLKFSLRPPHHSSSPSSSSSSFEPQHRPQCYNYPIRSMRGRGMQENKRQRPWVERDNYELIGENLYGNDNRRGKWKFE